MHHYPTIEGVPSYEKRPRMLEFANHVGRKKKGAKDYFTYDDPEYMIFSPECVTDEMADVIMTMKIREKVTAVEAAERCGKSVEDTNRILHEAADVGILIVNQIVNNKDGAEVFWYELWVPGIMEMMNNHKVNVKKYPIIPYAFEYYGRLRGAISAGKFPAGVGLMRVIPIESAIDGNSKHVSYEEVSKYLNDNTIFSVSDCSCRTSREELGEGCGHLKEDMCIQLGHAAEYYIKTGRAREITREEAFEIIKRAEENGLMHQIPNTDGEGHTHAICNCCGCGCYALRSTNMFINADMSRSNYVAKIDKEKCVACGECVKNCPTNALKLGQKLCSTAPVVDKIVREETPRNTVWTEEKHNVNYRENRENVVESGTAPCKTKCPAHISVQGYIKLASEGKYREALELIKKDNPFPAICGRVCPRGCESECTRGMLDEPIAIDEIKKFIAEQDLKEEFRFVPRIRHGYKNKMAIIGGGPAGLSCAYYLAQDGYDITVFEKEKELGGMLTLGIPNFRLEKDIVRAEIEILRELGVKFVTGCEIGKEKTIANLREEGFEAFFVAVGASEGRKIGVEGEDCLNVLSGIDMLKSVSLGENIKLGSNTIVIGGGNVAIDVSRTATRIGGDNVKMVCLESFENMPALEEEIDEAKQEGIEIINSFGPKELVVENGKVVKVIFKKCLSTLDENGRFSPKYDDNDTMELACDNLILSVGQKIALNVVLKGESVQLNGNGTIKVDDRTLQSSVDDIFAGGDVATGPRYAIEAIAQGHEAAISMHRFVHRGQSLVYGRNSTFFASFDKDSLKLDGYDNAKRETVDHNYVNKSFKDTRGTFTEAQVKHEAERCLGCGATVVDEWMCVGCGQCTTQCKFGAIHLERVYNEGGRVYEEMKPQVIKNIVKTKFRIMGKNIKDTFKGKKK